MNSGSLDQVKSIYSCITFSKAYNNKIWQSGKLALIDSILQLMSFSLSLGHLTNVNNFIFTYKNFISTKLDRMAKLQRPNIYSDGLISSFISLTTTKLGRMEDQDKLVLVNKL